MEAYSSNAFDKFLKFLKYLSPLLIAILYFQGYMYYGGILEAYGVNEALYPVPYEKIFIYTYRLYLDIIIYLKYIMCVLILLFVCMLFGSIVSDKKCKNSRETTNKFLLAIRCFIAKHKNAFLVPGVILMLIYILIILALITISPLELGMKDGSETLQSIIKSRSYYDLIVKNNKLGLISPVKILESSDKFVTFLVNNNVNAIKTIPVSDVTSIVYHKNLQDKK